MTASVMSLPAPRVSWTTKAIVESQVALVVAYASDDGAAMNAATREVCTALVADAGHVLDGTAVHDHLSEVVGYSRELHDLDDDWEGYLSQCRRPQTTEERLQVEADLRSDRTAALDRLYGLVSR